MAPGEKIGRALEHSQFLRELSKAGVRQRYPNASEEEIHLRFAKLVLGKELFRTVYGEALPPDESASNLR
jgi:hypothetical protein